MPRYDYKCEEHGYFELQQKIIDHARADCPTCETDCKQVLRNAPGLDVEGMADAGCPGAFFSSGDRMEKRHKKAGQDHTYWRDDVSNKDFIRKQKAMDESSAYDR